MLISIFGFIKLVQIDVYFDIDNFQDEYVHHHTVLYHF